MMDGGQTFGKYQIIQELGNGGFATVYKAVDTTLDREVALKILHPPLLTDRRFVQNFRQEAKTLAALHHPQIITIYEVSEVASRLYIAMELAHGVNLAQSIARRKRIPWNETLALLKLVCEALDYAHGQNVVHRDLKPANLLLDSRRGVLLTDFGFARLMVESTTSMSLSGGIVGTPGYIAPEVWETNAVNPPVDIYALGCILYEMLTGDELFKGQTPIQAVYAHSRGPQFPSAWPDDVPSGITTVLANALARDPADRYASASALWQALSQLSVLVQPARAAVKPAGGTSQVEEAKRTQVLPLAVQPVEANGYSALRQAEETKLVATTQNEARRVEIVQEDTKDDVIGREQTQPIVAEPNAQPSNLSPTQLVVILLAITIDIAGGQLSKAFQLPLWIDSIGTVLSGALLGPWIGAITGLVAHSLWALLGLEYNALWFAPIAGLCGLLAGFAGRLGLFQRAVPRWLSTVIGGVFVFALTLFVFMFINSYSSNPRPTLPIASDLVSQNGPVFLAALALGMVIGFFVLRNAGYAGLAGLSTGVITAITTAPIAAYIFSGSSGIDGIVVAFYDSSRSFWAILLGQGTVVEPFDKLISFMIVCLIIQIMPQRLLQRLRNTRGCRKQ